MKALNTVLDTVYCFSATTSKAGEAGLGSEYFWELTVLTLDHCFKPSTSKADA